MIRRGARVFPLAALASVCRLQEVARVATLAHTSSRAALPLLFLATWARAQRGTMSLSSVVVQLALWASSVSIIGLRAFRRQGRPRRGGLFRCFLVLPRLAFFFK